ncbi:hypothetical protein SAMN06265338_103221 [Rhodoblastus acidophilus]|uniref:Uncharacterized protein n=1 Tax=Rhodoblastus acidophilus TaxID=1074 RepID=A0A212RB97_RHOAC|nr:hypothetical protein [Rhodoblastus acidophilus]PPQ39375.1 hypothetical protein CKO16_06370 [Rhodoblastus acidophilus]RAI19395.1 hypothetical protein CH337_12040 [Rhodoblastus acidophilus]SNB69454.1 hypothetical protein SAMN06265338_103221 [Rhodoblastus acidophilus]
MEFAAAALSSLASGLGGAATAATSAVSSVGSAIGGASTFASILQGGAGLVGAMSAVRSGDAQAEALRQAALDAEQDRRAVGVDSINQQTSLRKALIQSLGERDVAYAASGVDTSFGTPAVARQAAEADTQNALSQVQDDTAAKQARLSARAASYRQQASEASSAGWIKGVGSILTAGAGILGRK